MAVDHIRYDLLAQEALRGIVSTVIADTAKNGLPGDHHFYVSFNTRAEGVKISERMRAQYPKDMTIVLQHQFWDLMVDGRAFRGRAVVWRHPGAAGGPVRGDHAFTDPSVQFGLQFQESMPRPPPGARMRPLPTALRLPRPPPRAHGRPPSRKGRTLPSLAATPAAAYPPPDLRHPSRRRRLPKMAPISHQAAARSSASIVSARSRPVRPWMRRRAREGGALR